MKEDVREYVNLISTCFLLNNNNSLYPYHLRERPRLIVSLIGNNLSIRRWLHMITPFVYDIIILLRGLKMGLGIHSIHLCCFCLYSPFFKSFFVYSVFK